MSRIQQIHKRPIVNRARSLARGLKFSLRTGWGKGFRSTAQDSVPEDTYHKYGSWTGSVQDRNYGVQVPGRVMRASGGGSVDYIGWTEPDSTVWDITNGFTLYVYARALGNFQDTGFFGKKLNVYHENPGYWLGRGLYQNRWMFEMADGSTEKHCFGGPIEVPPTSWASVVGTWDGSTMRLYVNGALVKTEAYAPTPAACNNAEPMRLFYAEQASGAAYDGDCAAAGFWNRPLTHQEIALLNSDPYAIWRPTEINQLGFAGGGGTFNTWFLSM